jgi:hypothetical protein
MLGEMIRLGEKGCVIEDRDATERLVAGLQSVRNGSIYDAPPVSVKFVEWWTPESFVTEEQLLESMKKLGSHGLWWKWQKDIFAEFALKSAQLQVKSSLYSISLIDQRLSG